MLNRRFALSFGLALSLSTMAMANSVTVKMASLRPVSSPVSVAYASPTHVSGTTAKPEIVTFGKGNNNFLGSSHGTISHRDGNWAGRPLQPPQIAAVPEPGSLLMLSTGLIGIAGTLRRKLQRS